MWGSLLPGDKVAMLMCSSGVNQICRTHFITSATVLSAKLSTAAALRQQGEQRNWRSSVDWSKPLPPLDSARYPCLQKLQITGSIPAAELPTIAKVIPNITSIDFEDFDHLPYCCDIQIPRGGFEQLLQLLFEPQPRPALRSLTVMVTHPTLPQLTMLASCLEAPHMLGLRSLHLIFDLVDSEDYTQLQSALAGLKALTHLQLSGAPPCLTAAVGQLHELRELHMEYMPVYLLDGLQHLTRLEIVYPTNDVACTLLQLGQRVQHLSFRGISTPPLLAALSMHAMRLRGLDLRCDDADAAATLLVDQVSLLTQLSSLKLRFTRPYIQIEAVEDVALSLSRLVSLEKLVWYSGAGMGLLTQSLPHLTRLQSLYIHSTATTDSDTCHSVCHSIKQLTRLTTLVMPFVTGTTKSVEDLRLRHGQPPSNMLQLRRLSVICDDVDKVHAFARYLHLYGSFLPLEWLTCQLKNERHMTALLPAMRRCKLLRRLSIVFLDGRFGKGGPLTPHRGTKLAAAIASWPHFERLDLTNMTATEDVVVACM